MLYLIKAVKENVMFLIHRKENQITFKHTLTQTFKNIRKIVWFVLVINFIKQDQVLLSIFVLREECQNKSQTNSTYTIIIQCCQFIYSYNTYMYFSMLLIHLRNFRHLIHKHELIVHNNNKMYRKKGKIQVTFIYAYA